MTTKKICFVLIGPSYLTEDDVPIKAVDIDPEKLVADLQEDIKAVMQNRLKNIDASDLTIWKLQEPLHVGSNSAQQESFRNKIRSIHFPDPKSDTALEGNGDVQILSLPDQIKEYWPALDKLVRAEHVYMIVSVPFDDGSGVPRGTKRKREEEVKAVQLLEAMVVPSPSNLSSNPNTFKRLADGLVLWNRPFRHDSMPAALAQEEFARFQDDCLLDPMPEDIEFLVDLAQGACEWYDDESSRRDAINGILSKHMEIKITAEFIKDTNRMTDGQSPPLVVPSFIRECKNHLSNALIHSIAYYSNFLVDNLHLDTRTRFPSVFLVDIGPLFGFYACFWSGTNIIVEPLTLVFDLTVHCTNKILRQQMASALGALKKLLYRIEEHYQNVTSSAQQIQIQPEFPFPNSFLDSQGVRVPLTFTRRINDKLMFEAETTEKKVLMIKFTDQYSEEAHRILADFGYAPQLKAFNELNGGWRMVVMDQSPFSRVSDIINYLEKNEKLKVKNKVKEIVQALHAAGFVHGDVRLTNILVDKLDRNSVHLIDFDWAGKVSSARYPPDINRITVRRPSNVVGGELITTDDDMRMIDLMFYDV